VTRLSEVVSALTPSQFTQIALLLFVAVFVAVAIRHGGKRRAAEHAHCSRLPLGDDTGGSR
jgi:hypothetical protein